MPFDFQKSYDAELDLREKQRSAVGQPIALVTVLGSVQGFMLQKFRPTFPVADVCFWIALAAAGVTVCVAAYYLVRAVHGYTYKRIPNALSVRQTLLALREWHTRHPNQGGSAQEDLDRELEEAYAVAASHNASLNRVRGEYLFKANALIVASLVATAVSFVPFAVATRLNDESPTRVRIESWPQLIGGSAMSRDQKPDQVPVQQVPVDEKPKLPPLEDLKEGHIPKHDFDVKESEKKRR